MRYALTAIVVVFFAPLCLGAEQRGIIGIVVSRSDYSLVTEVTYGGPAAAAGVAGGDRLLRIGSHEFGALKTPEEFQRATSGPVGDLVTLTIRRAADGSIVTLRLRRVDPDTLKPKDIPPEADKRFFASATPRPNQAMQLTASKPAIYAWSVCRRERMLWCMHRGLAAADLVSR